MKTLERMVAKIHTGKLIYNKRATNLICFAVSFPETELSKALVKLIESDATAIRKPDDKNENWHKVLKSKEFSEFVFWEAKTFE